MVKTYDNFLLWMRKRHPAQNLNPEQKMYCRSVINGEPMPARFNGNRKHLLGYINGYIL